MQALERNVVLSPPTNEAPLRGALEELEITPFTPVAQYKHKKMTAVMEQIQCRPKQEITPGVRAQTHLKISGASFSFHVTLKLFKTAS